MTEDILPHDRQRLYTIPDQNHAITQYQDIVAQPAQVQGAEYNFNDRFLASCTDMGDVSVIMPAVHGYIPCITGTSHGVDYYIADYYSGCISPARISAKLVIELLSNNAEKGRKIAAKKANMMSVDEYIRTIDEISGF